MNSLIFALLLIAINPVPFNNPHNVVIDNGYIEINHFWGNGSYPSRSIVDKRGNSIDVVFGSCIFDQVLIYKYDDKYNYYKVVHSSITKDGRLTTRLENKIALQTNVDKKIELSLQLKAEKDRVKDEWTKQHIIYAEETNSALQDVIVFWDSKWLGPEGSINNPRFNPNTNMYEVIMRSKGNDSSSLIKFTAPTLVETNTLFDPEVDNADKQGKFTSDLCWRGYAKDFERMMIKKYPKYFIQKQPKMPEINFDIEE